MMRRLLSQHSMSECPKRTQPCKYCGKEFVFDTIQVSGPAESVHYFLNKFFLNTEICCHCVCRVAHRAFPAFQSCGSWMLVWTPFLLSGLLCGSTHMEWAAQSASLSPPHIMGSRCENPIRFIPHHLTWTFIFTHDSQREESSSLSLFTWCVMILNDVMMEADNKCTDRKVTLSISVPLAMLQSMKCYSDCSFINQIVGRTRNRRWHECASDIV